MKRLLASVCILGMSFCAFCAGLNAEPAPDDKQAVLQADHALERALDDADKTAAKAAAGRLLDPDFTWTDAAGKTTARADVLGSFDTGTGVVFADAAKGAAVRKVAYTYGKVGVVQSNVGKMHVLRVWIKHPAGWRALVYHEVKSLDAAPTAAPPGVGKPCDNPCKTLPYQPKNDAEKGVVAAYMGLETSALAHNVPEWSAHVADEFVVASSNSDEVLDKPTRIKGLEHEKMAGVAPSALVSARMFTYGDAVVMTSLHHPERGKDLHVSRVWVLRDGKWIETLSYQTSIQ